MKIPIAAAIAAATTLTLTACGTPQPTPSPAPTFSTLRASAGKTIGDEPKIMPTAWAAITSAKRFGADQIDEYAAGNALESGRPVLVGLPNGGNDACHSALLVPGDPEAWILNRSSTPTEGAALSRVQNAYGCTGRPVPGGPAAVVNLPLDTVARDAAMVAKVPFIYALLDGGAACTAAVVLLDGAVWYLNEAGGATATGDALALRHDVSGCNPGAPATGGAR